MVLLKKYGADKAVNPPPAIMDDTVLGVSENVEAALTYLLGFLTGILFYFVEENGFVRFHAVQSMIVFGSLFIISMLLGGVSTVLAPIPGIGTLVAAVFATISFLLTPVSFVLWVYLMYRAYQGNRYHLPFVGRYAERYV